jgi:hypothetical protein
MTMLLGKGNNRTLKIWFKLLELTYRMLKQAR